MKTEEAIKRLRMLHLVTEDPEDKAAILKAIQVLKQPEIVHCKDCSISTFDKQTRWFYCNALDIYKEPEFYCGYARRREE